MAEVLVPRSRMARWVENFSARHDGATLTTDAGELAGRATDGSTFRAHAPFARPYDGPPDVEAFVDACVPPDVWGVLLVRKGGFAVARLSGEALRESKVGQRHVQGRTKAGGQSQLRFARRRDNQARAAYEAAADHAARILAHVEVVIAGGDHAAVEAVLEDPRLARCRVTPPFLAVPDPRRAVLEQSIADAGSIRIDVINA